MRKILISILLMVTLSGCYTTTYVVESTHKLDRAYSNPKTNNEVINEVSYTDEYLTTIPKSVDPKIDLTIFNNHTSSIRILWDESAYIDATGNAHRVIHTGVKFIEKEKAQVASVIPVSAKLEDEIAPVECIKFIEGNEYTKSSWTIIPFEEYKFYTLSGAENLISAFQNDPNLSGCTLMLVVMVDDKKIEYTLRFNGETFSISSKQQLDYEATLAACTITILASSILPLLFI